MKSSQRRKSADRPPDPIDPASGLKQSELAELRARLVARRKAILESSRAHLMAVRESDTSPGDTADHAAQNLNAGVALRVADKEQKLLAEIDGALAKFERGTYGVCEGTGDPIGYARLALRPWARHSAAYKELLERERWEERQRIR